MEGLVLLEQAQAAGLSVQAEGDKLRIRGPRCAEMLAKKLLERKVEIINLLSVIGKGELCIGHVWNRSCIRAVSCSRCGTPSLCPDCGGCRLCWLRSRSHNA